MSTSAFGDERVQPDAFDAFAPDYDYLFTETPLGRLLRARVWKVLARHFPAGSRVLELACGTGEDAVWLARRGVQVLATDGSVEMVHTARRKAAAAGVTHAVAVRQRSLQDFIEDPAAQGEAAAYDGVLSNFGGLNTISAWALLAESLAGLVRNAGYVVLVPMGPSCPWEVGWYLVHRQSALALRRFRQPARAKIADAFIPIWYPSAGQLRKAFGPWFRHCRTESLGLWLPPSSLGHFVSARPRLFSALNAFEEATARLTGGWGDHYLMVLQRR